MLKSTTILLAIALLFTTNACSRLSGSETPDDEGRIDYSRNSEFTGPNLRVFVEIDNKEHSVNTLDDSIQTEPSTTPVPGHQARNWTFYKETEDGTSIAHAIVSWDDRDPADYLMAGWWAEFPEQHFPDLTFKGSQTYAIVDGPEFDITTPGELPLVGQATYLGQAGGLYRYVYGSDWGEREGTGVTEEYQAQIDITADFENRTLEGCIGCTGDVVTTRSHFDFFLGEDVQDTQDSVSQIELHLKPVSFDSDRTFQVEDVEVRNPERNITDSGGFWGGTISNKLDDDGNPRLIGGFNIANFEEEDGSLGRFFGTFVAVSETTLASEPE